MAWTWLLNLAPAADDIIKSIQNVVGKKKRGKKLETEISNMFLSLYNSSFNKMKRDISIISGWKPVVSTILGVESIIHSWNVVVELAMDKGDPGLALQVITSKRVKELNAQIEKIGTLINKIAKDNNISWTEGAANINGDIDDMILQFGLMEKQLERFEKKVKDGKVDEIEEDDLFTIIQISVTIESNIIRIMNYWDEFHRALFANAAKAPTHFQKGLEKPVKEAISAKYDDTQWADIIKKVYEVVEKKE